jgi:hypothetical protein
MADVSQAIYLLLQFILLILEAVLLCLNVCLLSLEIHHQAVGHREAPLDLHAHGGCDKFLAATGLCCSSNRSVGSPNFALSRFLCERLILLAALAGDVKYVALELPSDLKDKGDQAQLPVSSHWL